MLLLLPTHSIQYHPCSFCALLFLICCKLAELSSTLHILRLSLLSVCPCSCCWGRCSGDCAGCWRQHPHFSRPGRAGSHLFAFPCTRGGLGTSLLLPQSLYRRERYGHYTKHVCHYAVKAFRKQGKPFWGWLILCELLFAACSTCGPAILPWSAVKEAALSNGKTTHSEAVPRLETTSRLNSTFPTFEELWIYSHTD